MKNPYGCACERAVFRHQAKYRVDRCRTGNRDDTCDQVGSGTIDGDELRIDFKVTVIGRVEVIKSDSRGFQTCRQSSCLPGVCVSVESVAGGI